MIELSIEKSTLSKNVKVIFNHFLKPNYQINTRKIG